MEQGKSIAAQSFKGVKSSEDDKRVPMHGTGKEFDALVTTLKQSIKDGVIDKENVHRLAHGLGVKPDELAQMIGLEGKDDIHALDQDESPEVHEQGPEVLEPKPFKDFRSETQNRLPFSGSQMQESTTDPMARQIALRSRGITSSNILSREKSASTRFSGINKRISGIKNPLRQATLRRTEAQATLGSKVSNAGKRLASTIQRRLKGVNLNSRSGLKQAQQRVGNDPRVKRALGNKNKRSAAEAGEITKAITGLGS
jgi:hypothetical protein